MSCALQRSLVYTLASALAPNAMHTGMAITADPNSTVSARPEVFTVALGKQLVPVEVKGRVVAHKAAYFGDLYIGYPKPEKFTVVFDTGSAHLFIPSSSCDSVPCRTHKKYNRSASASARDVDQNGNLGRHPKEAVSISYGTGDIRGDFVSEIVCMREPPVGESNVLDRSDCTRLRLIGATEMSIEPFRSFKFDGVLGLGLEALALHPDFNFVSQISKGRQISPVFGVFIAPSNSATSEITFGGQNEERMAGPLHWAPVANPEKGYWQVALKAVRIGSEELDICKNGECLAILDTGTSILGVPKSAMQAVHLKLARKVPADEPSNIDCRYFPGPKVTFDFGDFTIDLEPEDYSRPAAMQVPQAKQTYCRASLLPVDMPFLGPRMFLFGEPVLRKYYTAYDAETNRVAFALASTYDSQKASIGSPSTRSVWTPTGERGELVV